MNDKYSPFTQALHWLTALLVLVAFIYGPGGPETRVYSDARDFERRLHETLGLAVFFLTLVRLMWLAVDRRPDPPDIPRWMGITAKAVQFALYVLLLVTPLTAVTGAWLEGHPITWLAGDIAPRIAESHALGKQVAELHGWLGDTILWLSGFHAVAALYHHFWLRDGVLRAMLPGAERRAR